MEAGGSQQAPPGWYQDPQGVGQRYWDGARWTEHVSPAPSPQQPAPAAQTLTTIERIWASGAFAVAVIGSIGPWATLGIFSKAGTDGDGVITLIAASVGIVVALVMGRGGRVAIGIIGLVVAGVGIIDIGDVSSSGGELFGQQIKPSVGWGLWLVTIGGAAAIVSAIAKGLGIVRA